MHQVEYAKGFPWHGRENRFYYGEVVITVGKNALLAAINLLPSEDLLKGLVPSETYTSAPDEALRSQAIVARGELLAKIGLRHFSDPYVICASQQAWSA